MLNVIIVWKLNSKNQARKSYCKIQPVFIVVWSSRTLLYSVYLIYKGIKLKLLN